MTRQQVAQRLGKSLATVRRIEGSLLHPIRDARGQYRFDDDEVEDVARRIENGEITVWQELRASSSSAVNDASAPFFGNAQCGHCETLQQHVRQLNDDLAQLRCDHRLELSALREEHDHEARELHEQITEFLAMLET